MRADHLTSRSSLTEELEEKRKLTSQLQETVERQRDELEALKEAADKVTPKSASRLLQRAFSVSMNFLVLHSSNAMLTKRTSGIGNSR